MRSTAWPPQYCRVGALISRGALMLVYISVILAIGFGPDGWAIDNNGSCRAAQGLHVDSILVVFSSYRACTLAGLVLATRGRAGPADMESAAGARRSRPNALAQLGPARTHD